MKDRIRLFLERENKTSSQFAEEIGIQPSGVSHVLSGRNKPSLDFVIKMLTTYTDLNSDWLLFGRGEMYGKREERSLQAGQTGSETNTVGALKREMSLFDDTEMQEDDGEPEEKPHNKADKDAPGHFSERIIIFYPDATYMEYRRRK